MIIPGKIPYVKTASLDISISAGTMINQATWVPARDYDSYFNSTIPAPYKNLSVTIYLDNQMLLSSTLESTINFHYDFLDTDETTNHCIKIVTNGFSEDQCYFSNGIGNVSPMIKINSIHIEHLNMANTLEDSGACFQDTANNASASTEYIGQNGNLVLNFSTPIYVWLLENERTSNYYYNP